MLQYTPDSNHTECFNVFQTAIIQNATTYSRQQSYRMLQHIPDSNHIEFYNIFQTAIIQNATSYSRQHATGHRVGDQGSGHTTTVDVQTLWEAF